MNVPIMGSLCDVRTEDQADRAIFGGLYNEMLCLRMAYNDRIKFHCCIWLTMELNFPFNACCGTGKKDFLSSFVLEPNEIKMAGTYTHIYFLHNVFPESRLACYVLQITLVAPIWPKSANLCLMASFTQNSTR